MDTPYEHPNTRPTNEPDAPPATPVSAPEGGVPDPGSPAARTLALLAGILGLFAVFALQQLPEPAAPEPTPEQREALVDAPLPDPSGLGVSGKILVRIDHANREGTDPGPLSTRFAGEITKTARAPEDLARAAVLLGELTGTDAALSELEKLGTKLEEDSEYAPGLDIDLVELRTIYESGPESLDDSQRERLVTRLGWVGELALTHGPNGPSADDEARSLLLSGGHQIVAIAVGGFALLGTAFAVGLALLVIALVRASSGSLRPAFRKPPVGGSLYLELFAVFAWGFFAVQILSGLLGMLAPPGTAVYIGMTLQWSLLGLVVVYPAIRSVPGKTSRAQLGLHKGQGVLKEIGAGVLGYLAGVPIYLGALLVTMVLILVWTYVQRTVLGIDDPAPPSNPLGDMVSGGTALQVALLFALAVIWAPIVEELVFRGGLFRHMRSRVAWPIAAVGSTIAFALMHGYAVPLLLPVATLGVIFGAMREWRDSLIAPMTAHFIHNFVTLSVAILIFRMLA
ncbi:MAG: type II CAAX endopeptidase family protein [Planctomycetota bacterium]